MATTTASFSLASSDIASSPVNVSASSTLYKAGLTTGLDQISGMSRRTLLSTDTDKTLLISGAVDGMSVLQGVTLVSGNATVELASASPTLAELGVKVGQTVTGTGITLGTTVLSITDADTFVMSANATAAVVTGDGSIAFFAKRTANKANKVYICNSSTADTDFVVITINAEEIGRLYSGDWMFMPWGVTDTAADIYVTAAVQTSPVIIDYMVIGEGDAA